MEQLLDSELFVRVVDSGSFTKAADILGVSRALISKRIDRIEKRLNSRLLQRSTRNISVTEAGHIFYQHCQNIQQLHEQASEQIRAVNDTPAGLVRLTSPNIFCQEVITPHLDELLTLYPELKLQIDIGDDFVDAIQGGYDLMIRMGSMQDSTLVAKQLCEIEIQAFASPDYWQKHGRPSHPSQLLNHNCLLYSPIKNIWNFAKDGEQFTLHVDGNISVNNDAPLVQAALDGLGVLFAPTFMVQKHLENSSLEAVLTDYISHDKGIYAVYPTRQFIPLRVRKVVDFLVDKINQNSCFKNK